MKEVALVSLLLSVAAVVGDIVSHGPTLVWTEEQGPSGRVQIVGIAGDPQDWINVPDLRIIGETSPPKHGDTFYSSRVALGFRYATQDLYWSDIGFKEIHSAHLVSPSSPNQTQEEVKKVTKIYSGTSQEVNGLAVDWLSGSVYWTDALYNWITVAAGDQYDRFLHLVLTGLDKPMGIVVHPVRGKMYWCDWGAVPKIEEAGLDGENRRTLLDTNLDRPLGMTIDYDTDQLFWVDDFLDTIDELDLSTGARTTWSTSGGSPVGPASFFGISVYKNYLFVTDQMYKTVRIFNRTTQEHIHNIFVGRVPYDIIMYHEDRQKTSQSECSTLGCEHMCVSLGGGRGRCLCSHGYTLNEANNTCTVNGRLGDPMYVYSVGSSICGTPINLPDREFVALNSDVRCFVRGAMPVLAMAADVNSGWVFYSNGASISRVRLLRDGRPNVISVQTGDVRGMAVDWLASNLYYTDGVSGQVMVSRLEGRYPSVLCGGVGSPEGIALNPSAGKMYWVDAAGGVIWEADMDCTSQRPLVHRVVEGRGVAIDHYEQRLYWAQRSGILSVNLQGGEKKTLIHDFTYTYVDVAVYQDYFAWSDGRNGIFFADKRSGVVLRGFRHREANVSNDVIGYSSYSQPVSGGQCDVQNGGCNQICIPSYTSNTCRCSFGFTLAGDKKTCVSDVQRGRFLLFADPYHKQVYQVNLLEERPAVQGVGLSTPEFPSALAMDTAQEKLYWADEHAGVIKCMPLLGGQETTVLDLGRNVGVSSLGVIGRNNHMIFTWTNRETGASGIYLTDLRGGNMKVFENVTEDTKVVVDERSGLVYWGGMDGNNTWSIYTKPIDAVGQEKEKLLSGTGEFKGITISYSDDRLFWCTSTEIWRSGLGGEDVTKVFQETGDVFVSIAAIGPHVYLSYWSKRSLMKLELATGVLTAVTDPVFARITDIKEYLRLPPRQKPTTPKDPLTSAVKEGGPGDSFLDGGVPVPIVLGAGGSVLVLVGLIVGLTCYCSRRARRKEPAPTTTYPPPAHDNPTYITTELVGEDPARGTHHHVYEGLPGATGADRRSRDSDLPDIVMTKDGLPLSEVKVPPPVPSPREGSVSYHRRQGEPQAGGSKGQEDQQVVGGGGAPRDTQERFIFPLDNEQLVVHMPNSED